MAALTRRATKTTTVQQTNQRVVSIDALRGLIMVLMALDHANMILSGGSSGEFWGGPLPIFSSVGAFWIRYVTHLCAPGFFFLMGVGMVYFGRSRLKKGWDDGRVHSVFFRRGLFLIMVHFVLSFLFAVPEMLQGQWGIVFNVLYILGFSMMAGGWLLSKPISLLAVLALLSFIIPEILLKSFFVYGHSVNPLIQIITLPGPMGGSVVYYTFLSWFGLTLAGIIFGRSMADEHERTVDKLPLISMICFGLFLMIRWGNSFGNLRPMTENGWMAFLQLTKYPPSMTFALLMMSINLALLYTLDKLPLSWFPSTHPLLVFGRNPLFFYIVHHFVYIIMMFAGFNGLNLNAMLLLWVVGVAMCYPLCRNFYTFKRSKAEGSVWRML